MVSDVIGQGLNMPTGLSGQSFPYLASCSNRSFTNGPMCLNPRLKPFAAFRKGATNLKKSINIRALMERSCKAYGFNTEGNMLRM